MRCPPLWPRALEHPCRPKSRPCAAACLPACSKEKKDGPVRDAADDIVGSKGEGKDDVLPAGMPPV